MAEKVKLNPRLSATDEVGVDGETYVHGETYDAPDGWEDHTTQQGGFAYPTFVSESSSGKGPVDQAPRNTTTDEAVTANDGNPQPDEPKTSGRKR